MLTIEAHLMVKKKVRRTPIRTWPTKERATKVQVKFHSNLQALFKSPSKLLLMGNMSNSTKLKMRYSDRRFKSLKKFRVMLRSKKPKRILTLKSRGASRSLESQPKSVKTFIKHLQINLSSRKWASRECV